MTERPPPAALQRSRAAALCGVLALIALGLAWELRLAPTGSGTLAWKVAPLLLALPGLFRNRLYTHRWLSLLVWLYVAEGAVRAASDRGLGAPLGAVELGLALVVFVACGLHVRLRLRLAREAALQAVNGGPGLPGPARAA